MSGSSNFQQFNPGSVNQESDSAYTSDALRSGGITTDAIFASALANKLFYQLSTFVAAFAAALAAQGLVVSDANLATLQTVLMNVVIAGTSQTFDVLTAASILSTTGLQCEGGIVSGSSLPAEGEYAIYDSAGTVHNGVGSGTPITLAAAIAAGYLVCGGLIVP